MKKSLYAAALLGGLLALIPARGSAQQVFSAAGLAMPLQNENAAARAKGMGSAFVAVADDSSALLWNPAGLGLLTDSEAALHHNAWLGSISQDTLVYAAPLGAWGGVGAGLNYVNYGSFEGRDATGGLTSGYTGSEMGLSAGWGKEWARDLWAGLAIKGGQQTLAGTSYSSFAADLGVLYDMGAVRLGADYSNLGSFSSGNTMASAWRLGGSYASSLNGSQNLVAAVGLQGTVQGDTLVQAGAEDSFSGMFALRAGYVLNTIDTQIQGLTGLSLGLGVKYSGLLLDYVYLPYGDLGSSNQVSLTYRFGASKP